MNRFLTAALACFAILLALPAGAADPVAKPLRVVIQISENQPAVWNLALNNIRNSQKDLGVKNIEVEVVAYGPGLAILRDDSLVANRVQEAMATGVRFVACRNTMQNQNITEAQMMPGISYAQAGVIEIIRKQMEGYAYLPALMPQQAIAFNPAPSGKARFFDKEKEIMNLTRRDMLKQLGIGSGFAALLVSGLLRPVTAFAGTWNKASFQAKDMAGAMKSLEASGAVDSKDIVLNAPAIAENGAVVPISVVSNIPNTTRISILVEQNPFPLAGSFEMAEGALPDVGVRLKFSQTSNVRAVVTAGGKAYMTQKEVKVTAGGCGG